MKFFIDTANLDHIQEANEMGIIDGVTTNPSLMAKEGISGTDRVMKHYVDICNIVGEGDVSAEVIATDFENIIREGEELASLHSNIVVKVPMIKDGVKALKYFSDTLGPYPYKTVTVVIPPFNATEAGGMEYPTFFTAEGYSEVVPNTMSSYLLDFVTIHEFGHGYFFGLLGSNEFEEPMLDEGLN